MHTEGVGVSWFFKVSQYFWGAHGWEVGVSHGVLGVSRCFWGAQGLVYTVTDVPELHQWMLQHFGEHPLFEPLPPAQLVRATGDNWGALGAGEGSTGGY